jgi:hypothetical protein
MFCSATWFLVWGRVSFENSGEFLYKNLKKLLTTLVNRISLIKVINLLLLLFALKLPKEFFASVRNREFKEFLFCAILISTSSNIVSLLSEQLTVRGLNYRTAAAVMLD